MQRVSCSARSAAGSLWLAHGAVRARCGRSAVRCRAGRVRADCRPQGRRHGLRRALSARRRPRGRDAGADATARAACRVGRCRGSGSGAGRSGLRPVHLPIRAGPVCCWNATGPACLLGVKGGSLVRARRGLHARARAHALALYTLSDNKSGLAGRLGVQGFPLFARVGFSTRARTSWLCISLAATGRKGLILPGSTPSVVPSGKCRLEALARVRAFLVCDLAQFLGWLCFRCWSAWSACRSCFLRPLWRGA